MARHRTILKFCMNTGGAADDQAALFAGVGGELLSWMPQINVASVRFPNQQVAQPAVAR